MSVLWNDGVVESGQNGVLGELNLFLQVFDGLTSCFAGLGEDVDGHAQAGACLRPLHQ